MLFFGKRTGWLSEIETGRLEYVVEDKVLDEYGVLFIDNGVESVEVEHLVKLVIPHHQRVGGVVILNVGRYFACGAFSVSDVKDGAWTSIKG